MGYFNSIVSFVTFRLPYEVPTVKAYLCYHVVKKHEFSKNIHLLLQRCWTNRNSSEDKLKVAPKNGWNLQRHWQCSTMVKTRLSIYDGQSLNLGKNIRELERHRLLTIRGENGKFFTLQWDSERTSSFCMCKSSLKLSIHGRENFEIVIFY